MNKQKLAVLSLASIGLVASCLPWYRSLSLGLLSGMNLAGCFTFILFLAVVFFVFRKNAFKALSRGECCCINVCSVFASLIVMWRMTDVWFVQEGWFVLGGEMTGMMGSQVRIAYGAWIAFGTGISIPVIEYLLR